MIREEEMRRVNWHRFGELRFDAESCATSGEAQVGKERL
jgi:hypothetical protein